jgi:hypothetical protein
VNVHRIKCASRSRRLSLNDPTTSRGSHLRQPPTSQGLHSAGLSLPPMPSRSDLVVEVGGVVEVVQGK